MSGRSRTLTVVSTLAALAVLALSIQKSTAQDAAWAAAAPASRQTPRPQLRPTLPDSDSYVATEAAASPQESDGAGGADDPAAAADVDEDAAVQATGGTPQDGDLSASADAISAEGTPEAIDAPIPTAGEATDLSRDTRPSEDVAVFAETSAGYDPRLFQVEDIDPESDRREAQFARLEPYDPVGFRLGSFILFPEATLSRTFTNNVMSSNTPQSDGFQSLNTETRLVSNWQRHALEFRGTTDSSFHDTFDSEDVRGWFTEARGRLDFTSRTNLQVIASTGVSQEKRSGIDANLSGDAADITTTQASAALSHRFNRLTVKLKSSIMDYSVGPANGVSNAARDYVEATYGLRGTYETSGRVGVFADIAEVRRNHEAVDYNRDTPGERYRVGLDFGSKDKVLRGEVSIGYGTQRARDARLDDQSAFLFDTNLAWRPTGLTSFLFTAVSDIADTTSGSISAVVSRQLGIEVRHAFRTYVVASAGLTYTAYDYGSSSGDEHGLTASLGAEYTLNPEVMLFARGEHTTFDGNAAARTYEEDNVRFGVRVRR